MRFHNIEGMAVLRRIAAILPTCDDPLEPRCQACSRRRADRSCHYCGLNLCYRCIIMGRSCRCGPTEQEHMGEFDHRLFAVAHTFPMSYEVALMLAFQMAVFGWARLGGVLLLQWLYGFRPSEALGLSANDLVPASSSYLGFLRPACLLLALKRGTEWPAAACSGMQELIGWADTRIAAFKATAPAGTRLCAVFDTAQYQRPINRAAAALRLRGRYPPLSPRAGWASSMRLWGLPFSKLRPEDGGRAHLLPNLFGLSATLQLQCDEQHIMITPDGCTKTWPNIFLGGIRLAYGEMHFYASFWLHFG